MNDLIQKGFIPFGFKFTHLEIAKFFIEQNDYFTVNCVRDRSGKPTAACSPEASGRNGARTWNG